MQGTATVLLVSLGDGPEGLRHELSRLGLRVVPCAFSDAEESIETESPDLIILNGTRGAVELATVLDDQADDSRIRMVIVAERKALAKLRGLNREIVISLFAMETTDRVVGQRIESLVRRAVRRRLYGNSMAPSVPARKIGEVSPQIQAAAPVLRTEPDIERIVPNLPEKSVRAVDLARSSELEEETELGSSHEGSPVGRIELKKPESPTEKIAVSDEAESPKESSDIQDATSLDEATKAPIAEEEKPQEILNSELPELQAEEATHQDAIAEPFEDEAAPDSLIVMDDELLESLPPSEVPESGEEAGAIPRMPPVPRMDLVAPRLEPPALPSEAREPRNKASLSGPRLSEPGEYDVSEAMGALERLESSKLPQLKALSDSDVVSERPGDNEAPEPRASEVEVALRADAGETSEEVETVREEVEEERRVEKKDSSEDKENKSETSSRSKKRTFDEGNARTEASRSVMAEPSAETLSRDEVVELLGEPKKDPSGKGIVWGLVGVALMGALGVFIGLRGVDDESASVSSSKRKKSATEAAAFSEKNKKEEQGSEQGEAPGSEVPEEPPESPATAPDEKTDEKAEGASTDTEASDVVAAKSADAAKEKAVEPSAAEPSAVEPSAVEVSPSVPSMENPFLAVDSNMSSCDALLSGSSAKVTTDPLHESSLIWEKARKAIVSGKLEEANLMMCQAVRLYSESAAAEGLVQLYLRGRSVKQALYWLEKVEAMRPGQLEMANSRGDIYGLMGDVERARGVWLKALGVDETQKGRLAAVSKDYSVEAGRHLRRGDLSQAELWYRRAVILNPENLTGLIGLAKTFQRAEQSNYARAFCELSLKVSDIVPEVHVLLGELALKEGEQEEARKRFERALAVRPGFFPAQRGLRQVK